MRFKILKCGCVILAGSILSQLVIPTCPHGNSLCESQTEPPHVPREFPASGTFTVTNAIAASGSNVHVGIEYVKLGGDVRSAKS